MKLADIRIATPESEARRHVQFKKIPPQVLSALYHYVHEGRHPGPFLHAVLTNDLFEAVGAADAESLAALPEIVVFIYNRVPMACYKIKGARGTKAIARWLGWHRNKVEEVET